MLWRKFGLDPESQWPGHLRWRQYLGGRLCERRRHPLAGALVEACKTDTSYCQHSATQASGYYAIVGLPPGDYRLRAHPPTGANLVSGTIGP